MSKTLLNKGFLCYNNTCRRFCQEKTVLLKISIKNQNVHLGSFYLPLSRSLWGFYYKVDKLYPLNLKSLRNDFRGKLERI